ncbi:hypothetical protein BGX23_006048 [Mortierella sp. AD031]|nr:hypothetical protein BGX23_006048 [Mortierella sp. AD031]
MAAYATTHTLSSQLLKLQPLNFIFKSWKGSMHDLHWDLDVQPVRSEFIHWIRSHCKHFDKLPLETGPLGLYPFPRSSKSLKLNSIASSSTDSNNSRDKDKGKKDKRSEKKEKEDRKDAEKAGKKALKHAAAGNVARDGRSAGEGEGATQTGDDVAPTQKPNPASAEPEAIQDLEGLRRQQEMRQQKAIEKRREYNLESPGSASASALEEQQQQASQDTSTSIATGSTEQMLRNQNVIPTVVTECCSPTTTIPPQSETTAQSTGHDIGGLQTVSHPIVKEQTEMEKSLEAITLTLSRDNSLNNLTLAAASDETVTSTFSEVDASTGAIPDGLAAPPTINPSGVDVSPVIIESTPPATTTTIAEEIVLQEQKDQTHISIETSDPVVVIDTPPLTTEALEAPTQSTVDPTTSSSPQEQLSPETKATINQEDEAPIDSKSDTTTTSA